MVENSSLDVHERVNILLVDDQPANLLALEAILEELGHNLIKVCSGEEALQRLQADDFALVLLDVQMPGLDGFEAAKLIRARAGSSHTPIIFLTAFESDRFPVERAYTLGAVDYLVKPLVPVIVRAKAAGFVELFEKTRQVKRQADRIRQMERREFEAKLAEENARLRESEARKAAILETALDCIITIDHEGRIVEFNPAAEKTFGFSRAQALGQQLAELIIPPPLREQHRRGLAHYLKTGEGAVLGQRSEMTALRADGAEFPVEVAITCIHTKGPPLFTAHVRDLTERQRRERRRAARLAVTETLAQAATVQEAAVRLLRATCENLGWDVGALWLADPGEQVLRCIEFWRLPSVRVDRFESISRGRTFVAGVGLPGRVWASGKPAWIPDVVVDDNFPRAPIAIEEGLHGAFACPVFLGGEVLGAMEFFSRSIQEPDPDLMEMMSTMGGQIGQFLERRHAEAALRESEQTSRSLVAALKEGDRLKDEFLAMLAHELRNPLAPIRNALHIMRQANAGADAVSQVRDIAERQVQHMARLLDDLLDVSRISRGKIELRSEPVDLKTLLNRTVASARAFFEERRHELTVALPPEPLWVKGDPTRLEQIFANLLNNAAKYTDPGGHVWLTGERQGDDVVLRVRDNGAGIAADMLPQIFDLFVQAERRLDRAQGGVGIGLTLVKRLLELHGGLVTAHSGGLGQGSEFVVRLPAMADVSATGGETGKADAPPLPRRRILVVDDNQDAADSLAMILRLSGQEVRVEYDGARAPIAARDFVPEVVLLDIGMPGMDGYELARRLQREAPLAAAMLVALTGWGQAEDKERSKAAGFAHHLVKPVEPSLLRSLLAKSE